MKMIVSIQPLPDETSCRIFDAFNPSRLFQLEDELQGVCLGNSGVNR